MRKRREAGGCSLWRQYLKEHPEAAKYDWEKEFEKIGHLICDTLESFVKNNFSIEQNKNIEEKIRLEVKDLCLKFPIYE